MSADQGEIERLTVWIEALQKRIGQLEGQVRGLMTSQTVEAEAFVLRDDRAEIRARLDLRNYAPRLTFYDRLGNERFHIGLHSDGTPDVADLGR